MIYEKEKTKNISFPLGGIGTGCIGLAGSGALIDWEIFNRPRKNTLNGYSHFAVKVNCGGKNTVKVLQGDTNESLMGMHEDGNIHLGFGYGPHCNSMAGFPHFRDVVFDGTFPMANLRFSEENFPVVIRLKAFNPFIPHDDFHSSLPAAFFAWEIENTAGCEVECALAFSVQNPAESTRNEAVTAEGRRVYYSKARAKRRTRSAAAICVLLRIMRIPLCRNIGTAVQ